jgi:hypothetical protein
MEPPIRRLSKKSCSVHSSGRFGYFRSFWKGLVVGYYNIQEERTRYNVHKMEPPIRRLSKSLVRYILRADSGVFVHSGRCLLQDIMMCKERIHAKTPTKWNLPYDSIRTVLFGTFFGQIRVFSFFLVGSCSRILSRVRRGFTLKRPQNGTSNTTAFEQSCSVHSSGRFGYFRSFWKGLVVGYYNIQEERSR